MDRSVAQRPPDHAFARARRTTDALYYQAQLRNEATVLGPVRKRMRDQTKKGPCSTGHNKADGKADYAGGSRANNGESKEEKKKSKSKKERGN